MSPTDFEIKLEQLRQRLFDMPEVRQFFETRQRILADATLTRYDRLKRKHQRAMAANMHDRDTYEREKRLYSRYAAAYDNHPLVINYRYLRETVYQLLDQIKAILE